MIPVPGNSYTSPDLAVKTIEAVAQALVAALRAHPLFGVEHSIQINQPLARYIDEPERTPTSHPDWLGAGLVIDLNVTGDPDYTRGGKCWLDIGLRMETNDLTHVKLAIPDAIDPALTSSWGAAMTPQEAANYLYKRLGEPDVKEHIRKGQQGNGSGSLVIEATLI